MNDEKKTEKELCRLQKVQGIDEWCSRDSCIYWRLLEPQDIDISNEEACGLQHYGVFDKLSPETAKWLLDMKRRLENTSPEVAKSRITFRRREED